MIFIPKGFVSEVGRGGAVQGEASATGGEMSIYYALGRIGLHVTRVYIRNSWPTNSHIDLKFSNPTKLRELNWES